MIIRTLDRPPLMSAALFLAFLFSSPGAAGGDTLHSWNSGPTKFAVLQFVRDVTTEGGPGIRTGRQKSLSGPLFRRI